MTPKTNTRTWKSRWRVLSSGGLCTRRSICFTRLTYGSRGRSEGWDWWSSPAWCVQRRRRSATPSGSESHRWSCFLTSIRKTWLRIYILAINCGSCKRCYPSFKGLLLHTQDTRPLSSHMILINFIVTFLFLVPVVSCVHTWGRDCVPQLNQGKCSCSWNIRAEENILERRRQLA